jgi:uncharacterized membrane protein YraQ (UPF0718 family)
MTKFKKNNSSLKFLLAVLGLYVLLSFFNLSFVLENLIKTFFIFLKLMPILVIIFLIMFLVNKYLQVNKVEKYLGNKSGKSGWFYSVLFGILVSGPPYILFPLLKDLKKKGMKNSLIAVFLYNRNVKIPFLPVMIYYFGLSFTVVLSFYVIVFSIFNGILIDFFVKKEN